MSGYAEPVKTLNVDPKKRLDAAIRRTGSQRALAAELGVSQQYVCDLAAGRRPFSDGVLEKLGIRRVVIFVDSRERVV